MTEISIQQQIIESGINRLTYLNTLFQDIYDAFVEIAKLPLGERDLKRIEAKDLLAYSEIIKYYNVVKKTFEDKPYYFNFWHQTYHDNEISALFKNSFEYIYNINVLKLYKDVTSETSINTPFVSIQIHAEGIIVDKIKEIEECFENFVNNKIFTNFNKENSEKYKIKIYKHSYFHNCNYHRYIIFFDESIDGKFKFENHFRIEEISEDYLYTLKSCVNTENVIEDLKEEIKEIKELKRKFTEIENTVEELTKK